jgi:hypothetical protein
MNLHRCILDDWSLKLLGNNPARRNTPLRSPPSFVLCLSKGYGDVSPATARTDDYIRRVEIHKADLKSAKHKLADKVVKAS